MRKLRPSLAIAAVALAVTSGTAAAQWSNLYFIGDSLTDNGSFKPVLPPGTGLFTTNPGPVWSQDLALRYGLSAIPANQGGTNYAEGGARVVGLPGVPNAPPTGTATPLAVQVSQLIAKGPLDRNAIYSVWGGANDLLYNLGLAGAGIITPAQLQANLAQAATDLARQVAILNAAGARNIVVFNLPDAGKTPAGVASGQSAQIGALVGLFNSTENAALNALGVATIRVNVFGLLNEIIANPSAYGLTNVTARACGATVSLLCTPANLVAPDAASTYLFADGNHPSTATHTIIAQTVASMLEGPSRMSVLAEAPLGVEQANFRAIDARMISGINSSRPMSKYEMWGAYDYGHNDFNGPFLSGNANLNTLAVGGDIKLSERLLIGAVFGYTENKGDFGGGNGTYKLKETSGTIYAGYGMGPWWFGATIGGGDLDYGGIRRDIQLGALTRTETADARGWHVFGSVLGGYWFTLNPDWQHSPFVRVAYQEVRVHAFSEDGADSTALRYGEQKRESLITSLGWQVAGRIGMFRPFARVTWENESKNDDREVSASSVTLGGNYSVPGLKPDNNFFRYVVGASADFGRVTGFITGEGTGSKSDGNGYGITVGVRVPL